MSLSVEERAFLVDSLRRSLNQPESEIDKKWATEANHRLAELRSGQARAIPSDEVFAKAWKNFES